MSSETPNDDVSDGYAASLDDLDFGEVDPHTLNEGEYFDTAYITDWGDAERARRLVVTRMDGIDSVEQAAARRALPPATEGDDE